MSGAISIFCRGPYSGRIGPSFLPGRWFRLNQVWRNPFCYLAFWLLCSSRFASVPASVQTSCFAGFVGVTNRQVYFSDLTRLKREDQDA